MMDLHFLPGRAGSKPFNPLDDKNSSTGDDAFAPQSDQTESSPGEGLQLSGSGGATAFETSSTSRQARDQASVAAPALSAASGDLTFTNSFGLDGTFSALTANEQAALKTDLLAAEAYFSSLFTNTTNIKFDLEAVNSPLVDGSGFIAENSATAFRIVSLSQYFSAMQSVDNSTYQKTSLAAVQKLNLSASSNVILPIAYANMLGLGSAGQAVTNTSVSINSQTYNLSSSVDDTLFMNLAIIQQALDAQAANTPNQSVVGTIEHEMSEMSMGRISFLNAGSGANSVWSPMDFYRVNGAGQSDVTPNDGNEIFFSPDPNVSGAESGLQFNNSSSGGDYADWTSTPSSDPNLTDPFGPGDYNGAVGTELSTLSPTDIDIMNVLGWDLASSGGSAPPLTIALADDTGISSTDNLTNNVTLTGRAAANATIVFTSETDVNLGSATADAGGSWTFTPVLADGQHTVTATETYGSGQTVSQSLTFTQLTQAPKVSAAESVSGQTSETSDTITVTATAEALAGDAIA